MARATAQQFRQQADVSRMLVTHHHIGHACIVRQVFEKLLKRFQPARRRADAHHEKAFIGCRRRLRLLALGWCEFRFFGTHNVPFC